MNEKEYEQLSEIFKAISHPVRIKIVMGLMKKNYCNVSKMVQELKISQPNVSQHLNILKHAHIIEGKREGNIVCYSLTNQKVKQVFDCIQKNNNCFCKD